MNIRPKFGAAGVGVPAQCLSQPRGPWAEKGWIPLTYTLTYLLVVFAYLFICLFVLWTRTPKQPERRRNRRRVCLRSWGRLWRRQSSGWVSRRTPSRRCSRRRRQRRWNKLLWLFRHQRYILCTSWWCYGYYTVNILTSEIWAVHSELLQYRHQIDRLDGKLPIVSQFWYSTWN